MTEKNKKVVMVCMVIIAICFVVMVISTIVKIVQDGWGSMSLINFAPYIGSLCAIIAIFLSGKKKEKKNEADE